MFEVFVVFLAKAEITIIVAIGILEANLIDLINRVPPMD